MTTPVNAPADRDAELRVHVSRTIGRLQAEYRRQPPTSWAAASMAALRRADPGAIDAEPNTWEVTFTDLPAALAGAGDDPSVSERAAHAALVLYAVHQTSQSQPMHSSGRSLGRALGQLPDAHGAGSPAIRRLNSIVAASSFDGLLYHLRSAVTLLRVHGLTLDYGLLAIDLRRLQNPRSAPGVRMRWGRDYFRTERATAPESGTTQSVQDPHGPTSTGDQY